MSNFAECVLLAALLAGTAGAQTKPGKADASKSEKSSAKQVGDTVPKKPRVAKLFKAESPVVEVTFTANFKALRREKRDNAPYRSAVWSYTDSTGRQVDIPLRTRTRGIWRLANCEFPPLRLNFANKTSKATLFDDLDEPKLVSYCKGGGKSEQYVLQELQLYRIYRLLTPVAHQVRLLRVAYVDSASGKTEFTRYAFLVEDPARLAERAGGFVLEQKGATEEHLDAAQSALVFMFQYMIGNTDFSFNALHNGEVVSIGGSAGMLYPVAYDFDFAGAIDVPYAVPAPQLRIRTVRQRQFRGYCAIKSSYPAAIAMMQAKKDSIYALYSDAIGSLIEPGTVKETLEYFDGFYRDVKTPKDFEKNLFASCVNGT